VLPAAVSLRKQGASKGATTAFLISTPESGVDSISITYALLDPIMTVARPLVAFITAAAAGIIENLFGSRKENSDIIPDLSCPVDKCCDGVDCSPEEHRGHHKWFEKIKAGVLFAFGEVWDDMVGWFFLGLLFAGLIITFIPEEMFAQYLGGGLRAMLLMLAVGIPLYICATASTPIAAALILKGVSPGAALVFLMVGPATNMASLTVLYGILGKRATAIYLLTIAVCAVLFGLALDQFYAVAGIHPKAILGEASEILPVGVKWAGAVVLLLFSVAPLSRRLVARMRSETSVSSDPQNTKDGPVFPEADLHCADST
jgi:uncharacterized membrane protein YraQ (UPF0718 family)